MLDCNVRISTNRKYTHWNPNRIRRHMVLCFIAFLIERTIEIELKRASIDYSTTKIILI